MKKKLVFAVIIAAVVLVFVLCVCLGMKKETAVVEGRAVENADAVYEELGIDISMPEAVFGAYGFEYSIIGEAIGQVCFQYMGTTYYLQAAKGTTSLEEMGFVKSDEWWEGTTLYAAGDDDSMTGIESFGLEDGGSAVCWRWHGIRFVLRSPKEYQSSYGFINEIASNSYIQPAVEQEMTEE